MKNRNYPLYETTVFEDFRIMTENAANKFADRIAISYKQNPRDSKVINVNYTQVRDYVRNIGAGLISLGGRDRHVALIGESSYEWIASYFALMSIGAVVIPVDKDLPAEDMLEILMMSDCDIVIYSTMVAVKIEAIKKALTSIRIYICMGDIQGDTSRTLSSVASRGEELYKSGDNSYYDYEIDTERLATIVFTSGTTGKGKGVMLSQKNIVLDMTNGMYNFAISPKTVNVLPPHHTFGSTVNFVGHFAQGSTIYISSGLRYFSSEMKEQQPTHLILVPLFVEKLHARIWSAAKESKKEAALRRMIRISNFLRHMGIDVRRKLFKSVLEPFGGKLEMVICGGASLRQDIIDTFDGIGITILNGYGISECSPLVSCNRNKLQKRGSVGLPIIDEQVKIKDPDENGEGEICVKGPNVMIGYYKDAVATSAAFDEDGFFKTGDYGRIDEDGWIYITGRLKNLIIFSNGKNVYPEAIEAEISRIPGVEEVVVYAAESKVKKNKEVIVAEIFPQFDILQTMKIDNVQAYFEREIKLVNEKMPSYMAVGLVKIRKDEFSKNTSKKILRFAIDKNTD